MHFFSLLRVAITMLFAMLFTYFASFIGYEGNILDIISNLHVQGANIGGKKDKFGGKSF